MKTHSYAWIPFATLGCLFTPCSAAEEPAVMIESFASPFGFVGDFVTAELVLNTPVTAEITVRTVQTLADGNQIVNEDKTKMTRDSLGRVRREHDINERNLAGMVTIADPKNGKSYMLDLKRKEAMQLPEFGHEVVISDSMGNMSQDFVLEGEMLDGSITDDVVVMDEGVVVMEDEGFFLPSPMPMTMGVPTHSGSLVIPMSGSTEKESLGEDVIDGQKVVGNRYKTTYAAGTIGNTKPIVVAKETWYAPALKMMLRSEESDPRAGVLSYNVTIISTAEPDSQLFEIPDNFKTIQLFQPSTQLPGSDSR